MVFLFRRKKLLFFATVGSTVLPALKLSGASDYEGGGEEKDDEIALLGTER